MWVEAIRVAIVGLSVVFAGLQAPVDKAQKAAQILKETMERAGRYYLKKVPVEIDVSIADSWAEK